MKFNKIKHEGTFVQSSKTLLIALYFCAFVFIWPLSDINLMIKALKGERIGLQFCIQKLQKRQEQH